MSIEIIKKTKDILFTCNFHVRLKIKQKLLKGTKSTLPITHYHLALAHSPPSIIVT